MTRRQQQQLTHYITLLEKVDLKTGIANVQTAIGSIIVSHLTFHNSHGKEKEQEEVLFEIKKGHQHKYKHKYKYNQ